MIEQVFTFKRTAALCLVGAFCSLNAQAQKITVKGSIVDGTGEPLIGATVKVKGNATTGVISDMDGNFSLEAAPGEMLEISYIGYETQEVAIKDRQSIRHNSLGK